MSKAKLNRFARELLTEWRRLGLPVREGRVVLAVSGGADSTALALACAELRGAKRLAVEVLVAHLNHGLRGETSEEDARWVAELAGGLGFEASVGSVDVATRAAVTGDNLEQSARRARYEFLEETARVWRASAVVVAHTLDDQAETVLLGLVRGSGAEGLGGMRAVRRLCESGETLLARPLLGWARRADTEGYCREQGVLVRVDEMNADERFARVRVRCKLLPLLETFNPRVVEALARTAELLRDDASALELEAAKLLDAASRDDAEVGKEKWGSGEVVNGAEGEGGRFEGEKSEDEINGARAMNGARPLRVDVLAGASTALRRRALRRWIACGRGDLRRVELVHVRALERLLDGVRGGRVAELPGGSVVERRRGWLLFRAVAPAYSKSLHRKELKKD
ncbi:MAG TPA: tRNA lysidine(34) synthetase TilS [Pyrinomonadaceae bacterium]|jgi:tRNA(Ile)-lysidine synthase